MRGSGVVIIIVVGMALMMAAGSSVSAGPYHAFLDLPNAYTLGELRYVKLSTTNAGTQQVLLAGPVLGQRLNLFGQVGFESGAVVSFIGGGRLSLMDETDDPFSLALQIEVGSVPLVSLFASMTFPAGMAWIHLGPTFDLQQGLPGLTGYTFLTDVSLGSTVAFQLGSVLRPNAPAEPLAGMRLFYRYAAFSWGIRGDGWEGNLGLLF
ncbi:MAG: hypothetical protein ACE5JP_05715 [Candidatus Bipolaricaulia bacterium]